MRRKLKALFYLLSSLFVLASAIHFYIVDHTLLAVLFAYLCGIYFHDFLHVLKVESK